MYSQACTRQSGVDHLCAARSMACAGLCQVQEALRIMRSKLKEMDRELSQLVNAEFENP